MTLKEKVFTRFILVVVLAVFVGLVSYPPAIKFYPPFYNFFSKLKINLGLDLQGGIHLEYKADVSQIDSNQVDEAMQAIQDVIDRRVNDLGVSEPVIYTTRTGTDRRLIVELAGVRDINEAKKVIKDTPFLEFKEEGPAPDQIPQEELDKMNAEVKKKAQDILQRVLAGDDFAQLARDYSDDGSGENGGEIDFTNQKKLVQEYKDAIYKLNDGEIYPDIVETIFGWHIIKRIGVRGEGENEEIKSAHILFSRISQPQPTEFNFVSTGLTGKYLSDSRVDFENQGLSKPVVLIQFDSEGTQLFAEITKRNVGKPLAIYLDGILIDAPIVNEEISGGKAQISGGDLKAVADAQALAKRLNEGALPVPINLISQQSIEASLGEISLQKSLKAGIIGLVLVIIFMLLYYRFLGLIASIALIIYAALMIAIIKLSVFSPWQITLTLPGIAGFILSIGMAVDANILIFERTKEEIRLGRNIISALNEGFRRAWTSIRDGNVSSIITSFILIEIGTGFVRGFAVTLIIGVLISMFTAVTVTRTLLQYLMGEWIHDKYWLMGVKKSEIINSKKS